MSPPRVTSELVYHFDGQLVSPLDGLRFGEIAVAIAACNPFLIVEICKLKSQL
jgi:hypothetical protein